VAPIVETITSRHWSDETKVCNMCHKIREYREGYCCFTHNIREISEAFRVEIALPSRVAWNEFREDLTAISI
jgi:hypothetical protein